MRFLLILFFVFSVTLVWQSAAFAVVDIDQQCIAAEEAPKDGEKKPDEEEEPDCE